MSSLGPSSPPLDPTSVPNTASQSSPPPQLNDLKINDDTPIEEDEAGEESTKRRRARRNPQDPYGFLFNN